MAASLCPCCNDLVEVLLSLPCHSEHRLCGGCLERQTATIAQSIKCPDCRTRTAWLKPELLLVSDGEIPEQQACSPCRNDDKQGVSAEFFCQECQHGMCADCNQMHNKFFKSKNNHVSIDFTEYRKKADLLTQRYCEKSGHESEALAVVCPGCRIKSCSKCGKKACNCQHHIQTLEDYLESKRSTLTDQRKEINELADEAASKTKNMQESMEQLRVICESLIESINMDHDILVTRLSKERDSKIDGVRGYLKQCAEEVTDYLERSKESESEFRDLAESIPVLLDSTHPAHLIDVFEDVSLAVRRATMQRTTDHYALQNPTLIPESMNLPSVIILPLKQKIAYLRNVSLEGGANCYSADVGNDGVIYHADLFKDMSYDTNPQCIRRLENGDVFTLDGEYITRYIQLPDDECGKWEFSEASSLTVVQRESVRCMIVKDATNTIILAGHSGKVFIHDRLFGSVVAEYGHPDLRRPVGLCQNEIGDVYCTDSKAGSLFQFNLSNAAAANRICSGLELPSGVSLHRGLLYVLSGKGGKIYVITQRGELLNTLAVPEVQADAHDIRINDNGMVVIANREHGIQVYQLSLPQDMQL